jgi:hypothetical protein
MSQRRPASSRSRYRDFVRDYRQRQLDETLEKTAAAAAPRPAGPDADAGARRATRRGHMRWCRSGADGQQEGPALAGLIRG